MPCVIISLRLATSLAARSKLMASEGGADEAVETAARTPTMVAAESPLKLETPLLRLCSMAISCARLAFEERIMLLELASVRRAHCE